MMMSNDNDDDKLLPILNLNESLDLKKLEDEQHFTQPPARYTDASLVKKMEELGIGRPSTYASTLRVLVERDYVTKESGKLIPEERGRILTAFLSNFFGKYVDYEFTATLEKDLDKISDGKLHYKDLFLNFKNLLIDLSKLSRKNLNLTITQDFPQMYMAGLIGIGSGGMTSKIQAANISINSGTEMFIASGLENDVLKRIISGEIIGTKFLSKQSLNESRKRWLITGYSSSKGDITLDEGVNFVISSLTNSIGGEIFVPKIPSYKISDVAKAVAPECELKIIGIRPGEKLHEVMIPAEEIRNTVDMGLHYIIQPNHHWWNVSDFKRAVQTRGKPVNGLQEYASDTNPDWLTQKQIADLIAKLAV